MIEDLQDEINSTIPKKTKKPFKRGLFLFLAFLFWFIYAAIIILAFLPKMINAIQESEIFQIVENIEDIRLKERTREAKLCFVRPTSDGSVNFVLCSQRVKKTGSTLYHDAIEGLLDGPGDEALSLGAISFIEKGTKLLGLSVSQNSAFVDLSESFLSSGSIWDASGFDSAIKQIVNTLQSINPNIKNVIILVEGNEIKR